MQTLRISLNKNLEDVFKTLETELKPLSRTEIIKYALAEIYRKISRDKNYKALSKEEEKSLLMALKSPKAKELVNDAEIDNYFKNLK